METPEVKRLNSSVAFLQDGQSFKVGEFVLGTIDSKTIFVNYYSAYHNIDSLTKGIAIDELNAGKKKLAEISREAYEFSEFVKNKSIEYNLVIDTGGAGVNVCSEKNGVLAYLL